MSACVVTQAFVRCVIDGRISEEEAVKQISDLRAQVDSEKSRAATFKRQLTKALRAVEMEHGARVKWEKRARE